MLYVNENISGKLLTLFWMGGKKAAITFFPVTSANVRISSQDFLNFSFNPFATLV